MCTSVMFFAEGPLRQSTGHAVSATLSKRRRHHSVQRVGYWHKVELDCAALISLTWNLWGACVFH
jgi:hypothetical protein